ncbi:hypothetical protein UY3_01389 [Chelonia mydas]|uniref:Uncharacterized protein n=1 Tax=Chelonia mydas TaxID=8469 RepID=M7C9R7_CHEMY|nr:hypothetical protein UY3_01389 [Chelonia mydas]
MLKRCRGNALLWAGYGPVRVLTEWGISPDSWATGERQLQARSPALKAASHQQQRRNAIILTKLMRLQRHICYVAFTGDEVGLPQGPGIEKNLGPDSASYCDVMCKCDNDVCKHSVVICGCKMCMSSIVRIWTITDWVKVKKLRNAYHKVREANRCSGTAPTSCWFYKELDVILGGDRTSTAKASVDTLVACVPVKSKPSQEEEILDKDVEGEGDPEAEDDSEVRDACSQELFFALEEATQLQLSEFGEAQTGEEDPEFQKNICNEAKTNLSNPNCKAVCPNLEDTVPVFMKEIILMPYRVVHRMAQRLNMPSQDNCIPSEQ